MKKSSSFRKLLAAMSVCVTAAVIGLPAAGHSQTDGIDHKADELLHEMSDYLQGLKKFSVQTENTLEVILQSGQKIQYDNPAQLLIQRPNKLMASRAGDIVNQEFYYDGKTLTLYDEDSKYYATVEAPATVDETIDFARNYLDLYAPGGDLIYSDSYSILTEDVISGFYVGMSVVDGTTCHHLAFRGNEVDWQIWIDAGEKPLPKKFIVTTKWMTGAPQFTLVTKNWNLSPETAETSFMFVPPAGAKQIDFMSLSGAGAPQQ